MTRWQHRRQTLIRFPPPMRVGVYKSDLCIIFWLFHSALIHYLAVRRASWCVGGRIHTTCILLWTAVLEEHSCLTTVHQAVSWSLTTAPIFAFAPSADTSHLPSHNCSFYLTCFTICWYSLTPGPHSQPIITFFSLCQSRVMKLHSEVFIPELWKQLFLR